MDISNNSKLSSFSRVKRTPEGERPSVAATHTDIAVVFDRSASMQWKMQHVCKGFIEFVGKMQEEQDANSSTIRLTMVPFSTQREIEFVNAENIENVPMFQQNEYPFTVAGSTRLYDTAMEVLEEQNQRCDASELPAAVRALDGSWKKILVVVTDGMDNQSTHSRSDFNNAITRARADGTLCIFLGADQDAVTVGASYGFSPDHAMTFGGEGATHAMGAALSGMTADSIRGAPTVGFTQLQRENSAGVDYDYDASAATLRQNVVFSPPLPPLLVPAPAIPLPNPYTQPTLVRNETSATGNDSTDTQTTN